MTDLNEKPTITYLVPVCPLEPTHDTLTGQDCWACGLISALYKIACQTTDSGNPTIEASCALDECVEWTPKSND